MTGHAYDYVPCAELDRTTVRTAISPLPSVFHLLRDALQGGRRGTPSAVRRSVLSTLRARDAAVFAPLTHPQTTGWPSLLDDVTAPRETFDDVLQRLAATSGAEVVDALETDRDVNATRAWDPVRRDPDGWLRGYVDAMHRGWREIGPLWRRSARLMEREEERIGSAVERGVSPATIANELIPRAALADEALWLAPSSEPRRLSLDDEGITFVATIANWNAGTVSTPGDSLIRVAYPLPDVWRAFDDDAPPPPSLQALLGIQRTALLERLDRPQAAGRLAQALGVSPSAITFHLRTLEAAGVIARERRGRNVIVHRTARGTQLLALYASP